MPLGPEDITLTGKTLTGGTISGSTLSGIVSTAGTISGATLANCQSSLGTIAGTTQTSGSITGTTLFNVALSSANITASTYSGNIAAGTTLTGVKLLGTSTLPHVALSSNALLATPVAGGMEFDGVCFYDTAVGGARQVRQDIQVATITTPYVLTDSTVAQKLLNASTNGAVTVGPNMSYMFDCSLALTVLSTVAGTVGFSFAGTAAISEQNWWVIAARTAASSAPTAALISHHTAASTGCLSASSSLAQLTARISGKLVITTSGTVIPSVFIGSSAVTGTPQVERGAYFTIWPIGSNAVNTVGAWT